MRLSPGLLHPSAQYVPRSLLCVPLLAFSVAAHAQQVDKAALAQTAAGRATTTLDKARSVVRWANQSFKWTYTDYKYRTVDEIIARKGGNCFEQTTVVAALLNELGVRTRSVREINIQPDSRLRQWSASRRVSKTGPSASVFGRRHNDHVWMEFWDDAAGAWTPADPALDLVGFDAWLKARVGFEARPTHRILPSRDMLVPFAIFAQTDSTLESRTVHYLVSGFNSAYGSRLDKLGAWPEWTTVIAALEPAARGAFEGRINLHEHADNVLKAKVAYKKLAAEYGASK
jgi:hypothetical protein